MDTNSNQYNNSKDTAVLLISHGSTKPYNEEVFIEICEKFKKSTGFDTEVGYMKVTDPTIPQAIKNLKNRKWKKTIWKSPVKNHKKSKYQRLLQTTRIIGSNIWRYRSHNR